MNMAGEVIGINTAIYTGSRGFEGVGFALPSNTAITVYNQLVTNGQSDARLDRNQFQEERSTNPVLMRKWERLTELWWRWCSREAPRTKRYPAGRLHHGSEWKAGADRFGPGQPDRANHDRRESGDRYVRNGESNEVTVTVADRSKVFPETAKDARDRAGRSRADGIWFARGRIDARSGAAAWGWTRIREWW